MKSYKAVFTLIFMFLTGQVFSQDTSVVLGEDKQLTSKTVVFIHGLFMNNHSWDEWKIRFERAGYTCYNPANPFHEGDPATLRQQAPEGLADVTFQDWLNQLEILIDGLPEKPILIGHSFGGLAAQKLVAAGKAEAAILISSVPPNGILSLRPSFLKANLKVIAKSKGNTLFHPEETAYKEWYHFAISNSLDKATADALFEKYAVPESRQTPRAAQQDIAKIDTKQPHVPLLFVGGLEDVIVPNTLVRKNIRKYKDKDSIVEYKFFEGKDHFICAAPGWETVADYCLNWLTKYQ